MQPAPLPRTPAIPVRMGAARRHLRYATGGVHLTPSDFKLARELLGYASQRAFASAIGRGHSAVGKYECGQLPVKAALEERILSMLADAGIPWPYVEPKPQPTGPVMDFSDRVYEQQGQLDRRQARRPVCQLSAPPSACSR